MERNSEMGSHEGTRCCDMDGPGAKARQIHSGCGGQIVGAVASGDAGEGARVRAHGAKGDGHGSSSAASAGEADLAGKGLPINTFGWEATRAEGVGQSRNRMWREPARIGRAKRPPSFLPKGGQ